jgi:GGDEF domain-containing protein
VEPGVVYAGTATQPTHRIGDGQLVNLSNGESASELRFVAADAVTHELEFQLERAKRYGSGVTLVFFDLDDFKEPNDTNGHQAGDRALQQVAQLLRDEIRESDLAGRMDGDEFAALLVESGVLPVPVGLSAGLTRYPDDGEDAQALFALADLRLYKARRTSAA